MVRRCSEVKSRKKEKRGWGRKGGTEMKKEEESETRERKEGREERG